MYSRVVLAFCLFVFSIGFVSALPQASVASVTVPTALASPTSITTTKTVQTTNGTMTETCILTFTPVGDQIQEVQNCTMSMGASQVSTTLLAASSTASATATAAAAFVLPGTTLQVLPVGLGVYGGITAIAVAFVLFVTWERLQYRRAFRQQRMTENNMMGYGSASKGGN